MHLANAWARCPGTCGEWIQGSKDGVPFLVDCPIDRFVEIRVELNGQSSRWELPDGKGKAARALEILQREYGLSYGGKVFFETELPSGKGMASSTADISVVVAAVMKAMGRNTSPEELARIALEIEPSDSVMFPGITEIAHVDGSYYQMLGPAVPAYFLALDWGGEVDTLTFNALQELAAHYRRHERQIAKALKIVHEGIAQQDLEKLAYSATLSAMYNQEINPKPFFRDFTDWVLEKGGLGVITAHSGTLLAGVFPSEGGISKEEIVNFLPDAFERFKPKFIDLFEARDGGVRAQRAVDQGKLVAL